jgi:hypothetical protein
MPAQPELEAAALTNTGTTWIAGAFGWETALA